MVKPLASNELKDEGRVYTINTGNKKWNRNSIKKKLFSFIIMSTLTTNLFLATLVYEFWLSGLIVLSVIFLPIEDLDTLTLCTFLGYAVGSFVTGVLSDVVGRKPLFLVSSLLLFVSVVIAFFNLWVGLIAANICIGPLNNLTFLFLNENSTLSSEHNYVKVLLGWVAS